MKSKRLFILEGLFLSLTVLGSTPAVADFCTDRCMENCAPGDAACSIDCSTDTCAYPSGAIKKQAGPKRAK